MEYLFDHWKKVQASIAGKQVLLFLDYDGTLTPIVDRPQDAVLSEQTREQIKRLISLPRCKIVVISGRSLRDIKKRVGVEGITYSGNHGLEIEGPKIKHRSQVYPEYISVITAIKRKLASALSAVKGITIEDKGATLSVHYRQAEKDNLARIKTLFHETVVAYLEKNKIKVKAGKMVFEIRPPIEWDKGRAALWLLARQQFANKDSKTIPLYIGDDVTDEDAFKALRNKGVTIFVGEPKESQAQYYLKDTREINDLLKKIEQTIASDG